MSQGNWGRRTIRPAPHPRDNTGSRCTWPTSKPHRHTRGRRQPRDVPDEAYRRAFREHGIRMQQLGENGSDRNHCGPH
jgi:hypothetical protein